MRLDDRHRALASCLSMTSKTASHFSGSCQELNQRSSNEHHPGAASQLYNTADFSQGAAYVAGEYMPLKNASIPMTDRGFVRSDATCDVVHVWNGRFFRLDDYIERFYRSMAGFRMSIKESKDELKAILSECVRRSGLRNAYVQMTCTRGVPKPGSRDPRECINQLTCFAQPFVWIANEQQREEACR